MKNAHERERFDDFELEPEYTMEEGVRGRFYKPKKVPTTLRIDDDILLFLKKQASERKVAYQSLINALLREYVRSGGLKSPAATE